MTKRELKKLFKHCKPNTDKPDYIITTQTIFARAQLIWLVPYLKNNLSRYKFRRAMKGIREIEAALSEEIDCRDPGPIPPTGISPNPTSPSFDGISRFKSERSGDK